MSIWIRGEELQVGMTVKVAGRKRTVTYIKWGRVPWMLDPNDPQTVPAASVEADANFSWTVYPSDHYERFLNEGEALQETLELGAS